MKAIVKPNPQNPLIGAHNLNVGSRSFIMPCVRPKPSWLPGKQFWMWFSQHDAGAIYVAEADHPLGPYTNIRIVLRETAVNPLFFDTIAAPDVHIDEAAKRIYILAHTDSYKPLASVKGQPKENPAPWGWNQQLNFCVVSSDNQTWSLLDQAPTGPYYQRLLPPIPGKPGRYLLSKGWSFDVPVLVHTSDSNGFRPTPSSSPAGNRPYTEVRQFTEAGPVRHLCVDSLQGTMLPVYYSRIGDGFDKQFPESILCSLIDTSLPAKDWRFGPAFKVKQPQTLHEGVGWPVWASFKGGQKDVHQMHDPFIFNHAGKKYLYCTGEGEEWILGYEIEPDYHPSVGVLAPPFNPNPKNWTKPPVGGGDGTSSFGPGTTQPPPGPTPPPNPPPNPNPGGNMPTKAEALAAHAVIGAYINQTSTGGGTPGGGDGGNPKPPGQGDGGKPKGTETPKTGGQDGNKTKTGG